MADEAGRQQGETGRDEHVRGQHFDSIPTNKSLITHLDCVRKDPGGAGKG